MPVPRAARTPLPMQVGVSPPDSYFVGEQAGSTPVQHLLVPQTARIPTIASRAAVPHSRWREEWDQLEILGSGAFGSVKKARHRLDGRTYAVKQIRLRRVPAEEANGPAASFRDDKLWREVDTLSRLNHPRIVRYFGTWLEFGEADENATGDDTSSSMSGSGSDSASGSGTEDGFQRRPAVAKSDDGDDSKLFAPSWWQEEEDRTTNGTWKDHIAPGIMSRSTSQSTSASVSTTASTNISRSTSFRGDALYRERDDFGSGGGGASQTGSARTSFTSIIFEDGDGSDEDKSGSSSEDESDGGIVFEMDYDTIGDTIGSRSPTPSSPAAPPPVPKVSRTLYIQMEYVEQGTLKEVRLCGCLSLISL
jgi:translation initiation factor 2-alpha kinase 4